MYPWNLWCAQILSWLLPHGSTVGKVRMLSMNESYCYIIITFPGEQKSWYLCPAECILASVSESFLATLTALVFWRWSFGSWDTNTALFYQPQCPTVPSVLALCTGTYWLNVKTTSGSSPREQEGGHGVDRWALHFVVTFFWVTVEEPWTQTADLSFHQGTTANCLVIDTFLNIASCLRMVSLTPLEAQSLWSSQKKCGKFHENIKSSFTSKESGVRVYNLKMWEYIH